jgi:heat shock protein HslJ
LVVVLTLAACSEASLEGRTWQLVELEGSAPIAGTTIDMTIDDEAVSGSSGCNQYNGPVTYGGGEMTLGPNFAATMMACEEPIMDQEQAYLAALTTVTGYELSDDVLSLTDDTGQVVALFG